jgi:hypothetical protein
MRSLDCIKHIRELIYCHKRVVKELLECPMKFELVLNLTTAQVLGLTIPQAPCSQRMR